MEEFKALHSNRSPNIWHDMKLFQVLAPHAKQPEVFLCKPPFHSNESWKIWREAESYKTAKREYFDVLRKADELKSAHLLPQVGLRATQRQTYGNGALARGQRNISKRYENNQKRVIII